MDRKVSFAESISSHDARKIEENLVRSTRLDLEKEIYNDERKAILRMRRHIKCYRWLVNSFKVVTILVTLASGITGLITDNFLVVKISSAIYLCTTALAAAGVWAEKSGLEVQRQLNKKLTIMGIEDWKEDVFSDFNDGPSNSQPVSRKNSSATAPLTAPAPALTTCIAGVDTQFCSTLRAALLPGTKSSSSL